MPIDERVPHEMLRINADSVDKQACACSQSGLVQNKFTDQPNHTHIA